MNVEEITHRILKQKNKKIQKKLKIGVPLKSSDWGYYITLRGGLET